MTEAFDSWPYAATFLFFFGRAIKRDWVHIRL